MQVSTEIDYLNNRRVDIFSTTSQETNSLIVEIIVSRNTSPLTQVKDSISLPIEPNEYIDQESLIRGNNHRINELKKNLKDLFEKQHGN